MTRIHRIEKDRAKRAAAEANARTRPAAAAIRELMLLPKRIVVTRSLTAQVAVGILTARLAYERHWGEHTPSAEEMEAAREQLEADAAFIAAEVAESAAGIVAAQ